MKLYYSPGACSLSPHIVSLEAGIPVELSKVTFSGAPRTTAEGEDFFKVNPKGGYVPTLKLDDGEVMTEGPAIIQYLAEKAPSAHLIPDRSSMDYYRMLEWLTFISSELHKTYSMLYNPAISDEEKAGVMDKLHKRTTYIDGALLGKEYLLGSAFSVADAYAYTILRWSKRFNIDLALYPNVYAFMKRMEGRKAVQKALAEEELDPVLA